jgi:two-component system, OmpR family, response regulator
VKILLIEDDPEVADYVRQGLQEESHQVATVADGREGLFRATGEDWDLFIVDRMLPQLDGLALVRTLRAASIGTIDDRVAGLDVGGDDYLVKPFAFAELIARVTALGRRPRALAPETRLTVGDLEMDLLARRVSRGGAEIQLQAREFSLLEYLMRHAGEVVTRTMLLESVWDFHFDPRTNIVESHVSRLRSKVDKGHKIELIQTVRGAGYCIRAPA